MNINLVYAAEPKFGGWVSFTEHLFNCLKQQGHRVNLFVVGNKFGNTKELYSGNVYAQKITADAVQELYGLKVITALDKKTSQLFKRIPNKLTYIIHDPTELTAERMPFYQRAKHIFGIRWNMIPVIESKGLKAHYLPHPYCPINPKRNVIRNAVAYSRIDWDKHTNLICGANLLLDSKLRCDVFGAENRMYAFHKLDNQFPNWKDRYFGKFPKEVGAGAKLAATAKFAVDMSAIKQDGSGSQYTFLEAWDAGTTLVLNRKWTLGDQGEMKHGHNCLAVFDAFELSQILKSDPDPKIVDNGKESLKHHEPKSVSESLLSVIS